MWNIASECLFYGGPAVIEARAFLTNDSLALINYAWEDSCDVTEGRMAYTGKEAPEDTIKALPSTIELTYKLIPNLFMNSFSATITLGNDEQGEVQIYNMSGILMGTHLVGAGTNVLNLNNDGLIGGVYIYKVIVNGQTKTVDKLVVVN